MQEVDDTISSRRADSSLRNRLLAQIEAFQHMSFECTRRLNACTPFLRLPSDVLREIASTLADIWPPTYNYFRAGNNYLPSVGWMTLGHVCHALRVVVVDHCALWAAEVWTFPDSEAQHEFLHRSGPLPIDIYIGLGNRSHTEARVRLMAENLARARTIDVRQLDIDLRTLDKWPLDPAALAEQSFLPLKRFSLVLPGSSSHQELMTGEIWSLPPMQAPNLRGLYLRNFYVPFDSSTLTSLMLDRSNGHPLPPASLLLEILRACVHLQILDLTSWIPEDLATSQTGKPTTFLPSLQELSVDDNVDRCASLWSHLSAPQGAESNFEISILPQTVQDDRYFELIAPYIKRDIDLPVHGLAVYRNFDTTIDMAFFLLCPGGQIGWSGTFERGFEKPLRVNLYAYRCNFPPLSRILEHALQIADATHVQYLQLGNNYVDEDYTSNEWLAVLDKLVHVHTLYNEYSPSSLLKALSAPASANHPAPLFPSLRRLHIDELDLTNEEGFTLWDFLAVVTSRSQAGATLAWLRIDKLIMDEDVAKKTLLPRLRALISSVECGLDGTISTVDMTE
jgi:hypothetical protein